MSIIDRAFKRIIDPISVLDWIGRIQTVFSILKRIRRAWMKWRSLYGQTGNYLPYYEPSTIPPQRVDRIGATIVFGRAIPFHVMPSRARLAWSRVLVSRNESFANIEKH